MKKSIRILSLTLFLLTLALTVSAQEIHGFVVDFQSGDSIPYANAMYKGTKLAVAGSENGQFKIERYVGRTLTVSAVGYKPKTIKITEKTPKVLHVKLISDSKRMEEVVVKAKRRHKYSRKENPAVELMRRVIAAKKQTDLQNHDYYQFDKYQKITMAVNNITPQEMEGKLFTKQPWLRDQVEMCPYNNKLILPISVDETLTQHVYRKEPKDVKDIILGQSTKGISKLLQTGETVNTIVKDLFADINLYDDQIRLLQNRFPSPIGSTAIAFYHFYIDDTLYVNQDQCIRLQFMPANQQDFGFRGELYVLNDSSLHVKRCDMQLPANTGINFVDAMKFQQEYTKLDNGEWVLTTDNMVAELELTDLLQRAIVIRNTKMSKYSFEPIDDKLFKGKAKTKTDLNAKLRDDNFWKEHRTVELTKSEEGMNSFIDNLAKSPKFAWMIVASKLLIENFLETGKNGEPSKIDIGPINTVVSSNHVDGLRFRASARTTAKLNPHWFYEGYYAMGMKDKRSYYGSKATYSFNKKEYQPIEFPTRTISFESTYDVMAWADKYLINNKDNVFMAIRPQKVYQMFFYNRQTLQFVWETDYGLGTEFMMKTEMNQPTADLAFYKLNGDRVNKIRFTEMKLGFDFRPGQQYVNGKISRTEVNNDAPRFTLAHTWGAKGVIGGQFNYHLTEASIYKRFWLGSWGHLDARLNGGAQWSKVPFPLLIMPAVNTSYFEHQGSFNMMDNMEFLNDRYASMMLSWDLNGKFFNRIPLIKKLKWREYFAVNMLWGDLTDKNNPFLPQNAGSDKLMYFPKGCHVMDPKRPYVELVVGIHNIFKLIHIEYVRRMSYLDLPTSEKWGIRYIFRLTF